MGWALMTLGLALVLSVVAAMVKQRRNSNTNDPIVLRNTFIARRNLISRRRR
jgi:hypothetical protein